MKLHIASLALAFSILALPLQAQNTVERVVIPPLKNVEINRHFTSAEDFQKYKGSYELSNGKDLTLRRATTRMYARVGSQTEHEIVRTGRGVFSALDRTMHIQLNLDEPGEVTGSLTYIDEEMQKLGGLSPEEAVVTTAMR